MRDDFLHFAHFGDGPNVMRVLVRRLRGILAARDGIGHFPDRVGAGWRVRLRRFCCLSNNRVIQPFCILNSQDKGCPEDCNINDRLLLCPPSVLQRVTGV
jgi:hypothetical protein